MRRVVILGRGGAGKSVLARKLGELTGLPVHELDSLFWQPDGGAASPGRWESDQRALVMADAWILDGDLGPYDHALADRLRAADTIIVLDFPFLRCAWRTVRRGREQAEHWRWAWSYRRRWLPRLLQAIAGAAPQAELHVLRSPGAVRRFTAGQRRQAGGGRRRGRPTGASLSRRAGAAGRRPAHCPPPGPSPPRSPRAFP